MTPAALAAARCPEHDVRLSDAGACSSCAADHLAGERHPAPYCARCPPPTPLAPWTPSAVLDEYPIPTTERTP